MSFDGFLCRAMAQLVYPFEWVCVCVCVWLKLYSILGFCARACFVQMCVCVAQHKTADFVYICASAVKRRVFGGGGAVSRGF